MKIVTKILTFVMVLIVNAAFAFFMFGALILAMNGFPSAKSAQPGINLYLIWAVVSTIIMSISSVLFVFFLDSKKQINIWVAALISVTVFSVISGISIIIGWAAGLAFADYLFRN